MLVVMIVLFIFVIMVMVFTLVVMIMVVLIIAMGGFARQAYPGQFAGCKRQGQRIFQFAFFQMHHDDGVIPGIGQEDVGGLPATAMAIRLPWPEAAGAVLGSTASSTWACSLQSAVSKMRRSPASSSRTRCSPWGSRLWLSRKRRPLPSSPALRHRHLPDG